ncbi:MAG TPA: CBS domain-containing protein [Nevskiaceae bacterium]|nr:CBS domain-containing protein [Nevskiaceae bacterium]
MSDKTAPAACAGSQLDDAAVAGQCVADVMLRRPKALPATATVAEVRALLANPRAANALLADGEIFAGLLTRADLPASAPGAALARDYARRDVPTITPDRPAVEARAILDDRSMNRLVVLEADGRTLAGLVCLTPKRDGYCRGK